MPRPAIQPHLQRLLKTERIFIVSLFETDRNSGKFFCALKAPCDDISGALDHDLLYTTGIACSPDDAVHVARSKLWGNL